MKNDNSNMENARNIPATKAPPPKAPVPRQVINKSTIILRVQSKITDEQIKTLEDKYSERFGCKVVIIEANLEFIEVIDG